MTKHSHDETQIHLPPNSWVPVFTALSTAAALIGVLNEVRAIVGPSLLIIGLVGLVISLAQWFRAARNEYHDLPD